MPVNKDTPGQTPVSPASPSPALPKDTRKAEEHRGRDGEHRTGFEPVRTRAALSTKRLQSAVVKSAGRPRPSIASVASAALAAKRAGSEAEAAKKASDAVAAEAPVLIPIKPHVKEAGIPADAYKTAYETAFTSTLVKSGKSATWAPLIETLMQGRSLRQHMLSFGTLESTDKEIALLCFRHLLDVQLGLCNLAGRPGDEKELAFMINAGKELRALQLALGTREVKSALRSPPSLIHTLTHLCLGAITLNIGELRKFFPEAESTDSDHSDDSSVSLPEFVNPIYSAKATMAVLPSRATIAVPLRSGKSISSGTSLIDKLTIAGDEYLRYHFPDSFSKISALHSSARWASLALNSMKDKWDPDADPIRMLIRHTEELRKTRQEPIVWNIGKIISLATVASAIAAFMTYKVPNPYNPENVYKAPDAADGLFTRDVPEASTSATPLPTASATASAIAEAIASAIASATATLSATASSTASPSESISMDVTVTRSASGSISVSITPSPSPTAFPTTSGSSFATSSRSPSGSSTGLPSDTASMSGSPTGLPTNTASRSGSGTGTPSPSLSASSSDTASSSYTATVTVSRTASGSVSVSFTPSQTSSLSPSNSASFTRSPSITAAPSPIDCHTEVGNYWLKTLDLGGDTQGYGMLTASDGDLIISGKTTAFDPLADIAITKLRNDGSIVWSKRIAGSKDDWAGRMVNTADGEVLLIGTTYSTSIYYYNGDILLTKVGLGGNITSLVSLGGAGTDYGTSIFKSLDGNIFLTGGVEDGTRGMIAKLDPYGNFLWKNKLHLGDLAQVNNLAFSPTGNVILVGFYRAFSDAENHNIFVAIVDPNDGHLISAKTLVNINDDLANYVLVGPDGSIYILGQSNSFGSKYTTVAIKMNPDLSIAWQKIINDVDYSRINNIAFTENGDLILLGATSKYSTDTEKNNPVVMIMNPADGTVVSAEVLRFEGAGYGLIVANNSLTITGNARFNSTGNMTAFVARLTPEGRFPFDTPLIQQVIPSVRDGNFTIADLNMTVSNWTVTPQNSLSSFAISDITLDEEDMRCAPVSARRLLEDVTDSEPALLSPSKHGLFSPTPTPRLEYAPSLELPPIPVRPTPEDFGAVRWDSSSRSSRSITSSLSGSTAIDYSSPTILLWLIGLLLLCAVGRRASHSTGALGMFSKKAKLPALSARDESDEVDSVVVDMNGGPK